MARGGRAMRRAGHLFSVVAVFAAAFLYALGARAHHSLAVYASERIELAGEVAAVSWQNAHVFSSSRRPGTTASRRGAWKAGRSALCSEPDLRAK